MPIASTVFDTGAPPVSGFLVTPNPDLGIGQTAGKVRPPQHIRLTLVAVPISITAALDYGSAELCTLPDTNVLVFGCEANLTLTKGGVTNGLVAATDLDVAIGTAAASNVTLATTMLNILPKVDADADSLSDVVQSHSLAATPVFTGIADATTNKLYLNAAVAAGITADDVLTVSGTIDLFLFDLGNVTS